MIRGGIFSDDGNDLIGVELTGASKVIVSSDYKFKFNGNTIQIKNADLDAAGDIVVTCDENGNVELDVSSLTASEDAVFKIISTGGANKIIPPTSETYIKIGTATYTYAAVAGAEDEKAYFMLDGTTVTGFVLFNEGDSITVKDSSFKVYDNEILAGSEVITGKGYTVTKTRYGYVAEITAASSSLKIGDTEFAFSISKETRATFTDGGIKIYFDEEGNIEGVQNLDLLTDDKDSIIVKAPNLTDEEGGIPLIAPGTVVPASGLITTALINGYISVSGGNVTLTINNDDDSAVIAGVKGSHIIKNTGSFVTINASAGNDTIQNGNSDSYSDSEDKRGSNVSINGGAGNDDIHNNGGNNVIIKGGEGDDTINNDGWTGGGRNSYIDGGDGNDQITNTDDASDTIIKGGAGNDGISNIQAYGVDIDGGKGDDHISNTAGGGSFKGGAGDDRIDNNGGSGYIDGGNGNDTITNSSYDDGGDGADIFVYAKGDGSDTITDYAEEDLIKITSGKIDKISTTSAGSVVFKIGDGKLTLKNAADKIVSYEDAAGKKSFYPIKFNSKGTAATLPAAYGKDSFDFAAFDGLKNFDASAVNHSLNITGNSLANKITGTKNADTLHGGAGKDKLYGGAGNDSIFGGAGNDSLWGGAGNDKLWGDAGNDTFIYTANEGTDRIYDFETGDMLKILNADGSYGSFKSSKYSGGDLTLTVNGGGKIILYDVSTSDRFNINGTSYKISGSKLK